MTLSFRQVCISIFVFLLTACNNQDDNNALSYEDISNDGELIIVTRNAPTTWYIDSAGQSSGYEYDLAQAYASALGLKTKFVIKDSLKEIFDTLESGQAHIAAAGLTVIKSRQERFLVGPKYQTVTQQLVCHRNVSMPDSLEALATVSIQITKNSSYSGRLNEISAKQSPLLTWEETDNHSTEAILKNVADRKVDCTVADSNIVKINQRYFPELKVAMDLTKPQDLALFLPKNLKPLQQKLKTWHKSFKASDAMKKIHDKYYGYFYEFDYVDVRAFTRRLDERLPRYKRYFATAAERHDIPVTTLMAQAYQESHWDPKAVSPTGVKGIMMLTQSTAEELDINNRLDPKKSILGGAEYLNKMQTRFVDDVEEDDRLWLSLAAYNVGRAHMHDAQTLARQLDLSPYHWHDMKQVLPLLSQKKYYKDLKYGYARGTEPVRYVQRIREYQHILEQALD